jgi:hypothetical protein
MSGFGTAPFGFAFFGYGSPDSVAAPPVNNPAALYINPDTNDFVLDDDGSYLDMPGTRQRVYLALKSNLGTLAGYETFGSDLFKLGKIDSSFQVRAKSSVRKALDHLVQDNSISLTSVDVTAVGGRVSITVSYFDLINQASDNATMIL